MPLNTSMAMSLMYARMCLHVFGFFTSPARGGGRHLRESSENTWKRNKLLLVHEPQGEARREGEFYRRS